MIKLSSCNQCSSFLPTGISTCPNCATRIGTKVRRVARPLVALTGGVLAMTLSACYGGGVESYDSGSTPDSAMDSSADTGGGDSATGDSGSDDAATDASDDAAADAASDASGDASGDATTGDGGGDSST